MKKHHNHVPRLCDRGKEYSVVVHFEVVITSERLLGKQKKNKE